MKNEILIVVKKVLNGYIKYYTKYDDDLNKKESKLLHSDLGSFRKQLMNQNLDIDEDYRKILQERFSHGTKLAKNIYVKYVNEDSIASLDYPGVPCYNNHDKKIYLNASMDLVNPRSAGASWFHEHGHLIDNALCNISEDDKFKKILELEAFEYRINYGKKHKIKSIEEIDKAISDELNDMRLHSAVSDLMEGLTDGKIVNVGWHGLNYWNKDKYAVTREAFAHMYECQFDDLRYKEMKKYFPKSLKYFEKMLKIAKGR